MVEDCSVSTAFSSNLELLAVFEWVLFVVDALLINPPALVSSIVAIPEDSVSHVIVFAVMNIKAVTTVVSEVLAVSFVPVNLLFVSISPWSDDCVLANSECVSISVGNGVVLPKGSSDRASSGVPNKPLVVVEWSVVLNLQ
jgi:hypothetical protein